MWPIARRDAPVKPENAARYTNLSQIGTRASGAGVVFTGSNRLANGSIVLAAEQGQIGLEGERLTECKGVTPDIDVDNPLHSPFKGEDAQLAAAIRLLKEKRSAKPALSPPVTPYPQVNRQ